jgi:hypothetical protein
MAKKIRQKNCRPLNVSWALAFSFSYVVVFCHSCSIQEMIFKVTFLLEGNNEFKNKAM